MPNTNISRYYLPQLDGLRTLAVSLVILFHWVPENHWINFFPNGTIGVTLFFVLSGYLITDILLANKPDNYNELLYTYRNFLIRRALRIFPLYYFTLLIVWVAPVFRLGLTSDLHQYPAHYLLFFYNHLLEKTGNWSDILSPFWSLAVEEQFYILWAVLILAIDRKYTRPLLLATILLGIVARFYFIYQKEGQGLLTITCMDCFAWGGLLAWYKQNGDPAALWKPLSYGAAISALFVLYITLATGSLAGLLNILFLRTSLACIGAFLILLLATRSTHWFSRLLSWKPVSFTGKISYGIYVFHMLIPAIFWALVEKAGIGIKYSYIVSTVVLLVGCYLSWTLLENPINSFKRLFPYKRKSRRYAPE